MSFKNIRLMPTPEEIKKMEHVETVLETISVNASAQSFFEDRDTTSNLILSDMQDFEQVNGKLVVDDEKAL